MSLLSDLLEATLLPNLTDTQKGMLIAINASATPQQAYEVSSGTSLTTIAKDELIRMGMIIQNGNNLELTQLGQDALNSNNLIDQSGEITDEGQEKLDMLNISKQEYINLESFEMLKSFYQ